MKRHFSIDLETMGLAPGCVIVSIGVAEFDENKVIRSDQINVSAHSCMKAGLTIDPDTVNWWLKRSDEARNALFIPPPVSLDIALNQLNGILHTPNEEDDLIVWGNGATFDLGILAAAYTAVGRTPPWHFRHERDVRTVKDIGRRMGIQYPERPELGHHLAEIDAIHQAKIVSDTLHLIRPIN